MNVEKFNPIVWCALWVYLIFMALLLSAEFIAYSTLSHIVVCIGMVEIWDTMADHYRFQGFNTSDELKRGNHAVALYYLARVVLVVGCMYVGQSAL